MSEEKKYVTFRDLRTVAPAQKPSPSPTSASISSTSSTSDTPNPNNLSPLPATFDEEQKAGATSVKLGQSTASTSSSTSIPRVSSTTSIAEIPESETATDREVSVEKPKRLAVAPERDFQKIPNSITRKAI